MLLGRLKWTFFSKIWFAICPHDQLLCATVQWVKLIVILMIMIFKTGFCGSYPYCKKQKIYIYLCSLTFWLAVNLSDLILEEKVEVEEWKILRDKMSTLTNCKLHLHPKCYLVFTSLLRYLPAHLSICQTDSSRQTLSVKNLFKYK